MRKCSKTFLAPQEKPLDEMYLPVEKAGWLLGSCSKATALRAWSASRKFIHTAILKLLVLAGEKCDRIMARKVVNVKVRVVDRHELWALIGKKQKRVLRPTPASEGERGTRPPKSPAWRWSIMGQPDPERFAQALSREATSALGRRSADLRT